MGEKIHMVTLMRWNIDEMEEQGVSCLDIGGTRNKSRTVDWGLILDVSWPDVETESDGCRMELLYGPGSSLNEQKQGNEMKIVTYLG